MTPRRTQLQVAPFVKLESGSDSHLMEYLYGLHD
jgi:hypothetical protein